MGCNNRWSYLNSWNKCSQELDWNKLRVNVRGKVQNRGT